MIAALSERGRASLLAFIAEREGIRLRRASGAPPPWTDDPILREWSFCNVRREDDRGTRWIAQHWRDPHADDPDVWFPMAAARLTNWPPTLLEIRYPVPWNREHFVTTLQERAARGDKVWGDAYTIPAGEKGVSKYDHIAGVLDKLWTARERLRPKPGERLVDFHNRLRDRKGLGDFLAAQVVADVKYVEPLKSASDWMAFAASGPGSRRGLNRVMGRDKDAAWEEYNWRARLKELREAIAPELERTGLGDLHAQDLQNCLCEFDKYERVRLNEGKPKRRFVPHGTEAAEKPAKRVKTKPAAPLAADPDNAASAPPRSAREASRAAEPVEIVIEPDAQPVETVVAIGSGATVLKAAAPIVRQENRTPPPRPPVEITVLTKSDGILSKRISLRADGKVNSDGSECRMARGTAQRVQVAEAAGLAALISGMQSNQALALGALRSGLPETVTVITKDALEKVNGAPRPDVIARTGSNISFRAGKQAWALVDFDTKGMPADVADVMERHGGFMPALATVMPELAGAACVIRSSTSSGLSRADTGESLPGSSGLHVYVAVKDGADIERFLRTLHDRCWLAGLGWKRVGVAGQLLDRSIVDAMVGMPERLVFEGAPIIEPPLQQDGARRRPVAIDGAAINTSQSCPPLTTAERSRLEDLQAAASQRLAGESAAALNAFKKAQAKLLVTRTGMTEAEAARAVTRQCAGVLHPDIKLPFDDVEFANCTVADVLADPERFVGATLADPLEGVRYGRGKAKVMQRADGSLWIHSFAHGRTVYTLKLDAKAAHAILAKTAPDAAIATFIELTASADLDEVERLKLRELTAKISGEGVRAIDKIVKDGKQERNAKAKHERKQRARAEHKQRDTRVLLKVPAEKDELIPVMETIFDVLRNATGANHPTVDMEGCLTEGIKRRIPPGMHVL